MKLQQSSAVLACFLLFLLTISPEFSEAAFSLRVRPKKGTIDPNVGSRLPPNTGGSGSATPVAIKKWWALFKKYEEAYKILEKYKKAFKRLEKTKEKVENVQDIVDFWNTYAPGQVSPACRDLAINSTKIGPSPKVVTFCNPRRCTESCNNDSYNCGVCFRAHLCLCYTN